MTCVSLFWKSVVAALVLAALVGTGSGATAEAQVPDSIRQEALRDYHGADLEGKDGPLAKAGMDLLVLYHAYRTAEQQAAFTSPIEGIRVREGRVTIDATASEDPQQLRRDLEALGLTGGAVARRLVSGRLPIEAIPAAAQLESLRGVVPSRMQTRSSANPVQRGGPVQPDTIPDRAPETRAGRLEEAKEEQSGKAPSQRGAQNDSAGTSGSTSSPEEKASAQKAPPPAAGKRNDADRLGDASAGTASEDPSSSDEQSAGGAFGFVVAAAAITLLLDP
jgi:hypothetical protein